jgi:hypothetical protein
VEDADRPCLVRDHEASHDCQPEVRREESEMCLAAVVPSCLAAAEEDTADPSAGHGEYPHTAPAAAVVRGLAAEEVAVGLPTSASCNCG